MGDRSRKTSLFSFNSPKLVESPQRRISLYQLQQVGNAITSVFSNISKDLNTNDTIDELTATSEAEAAGDQTATSSLKKLLVIDSNTENDW